MKRRLLLYGIASVAIAAAAVALLDRWLEGGPIEIGWQGYLALGLGIGFTLLVGTGLMALLHFSARRGYDELGDASPPPAEEPRRDNRE